MSSTPQPARVLPGAALPAGRSPLAHLLHALNQPLTGLQCSLELGAAGPQRSEQYVRILREGLELTGRMRVLVEAIRELTELKPPEAEEMESLMLDRLVRATVDDLVPVAEVKRVRLGLAFEATPPLAASGLQLSSLLFRTLESALSLTREGGDLKISCKAAGQGASLAVKSLEAASLEIASLEIAWSAGPLPANSPFSPAELGLLVAQAGWEQAGAEWTLQGEAERPRCTINFPLSASRIDASQAVAGQVVASKEKRA